MELDNLTNQQIKNEKIDTIEHFYPPQTKFIEIKGRTKENHIAKVILKCTNKEEFTQWLKKHQALIGVTFRLQSVKNTGGPRVLYKALYRCHHNTIPSHHKVKNPSKKHTGCQTKMLVTIKSAVVSKRSKNKLQMEYQTIATFFHNHNHIIDGAEALKYKDPSEEVKIKFLDLFKSHHSPAKALSLHKQDLQYQFEDDYVMAVADRSLCPDMKWVYRLYHSKFVEEMGKQYHNVQDILESIQQSSSKDNVKIKFKILDDDNFVLALCTPLMERIHDTNLAGNTVFMDTSTDMDKYRSNCRVFLLMCDSHVGGLPMGIFLSTSETEEAIGTGLDLLKSIFPESAFGGNPEGPEILVIDDSPSQQSAIASVFLESKIRTSPLHVLQAVWRWLLDKKHAIHEHDRQELYSVFQSCLTCTTKDNFLSKVSEVFENMTVKKYPLFIDYVRKYLQPAEKWSHCFHCEIGNSTNVMEATKNVLKDKILSRTRAYNVQQLVHFLCVTLPDYYSQKIVDFISGDHQTSHHSTYLPNDKRLADLQFIQKGTSVYTVKNPKNNSIYSINIDVGLCSCPVGLRGAPCKHQDFVAFGNNLPCVNVVPVTDDDKYHYHWIATGNENMQTNCHDSLTSNEIEELTMNQESKDDTHSPEDLQSLLSEDISDSSEVEQENEVQKGKVLWMLNDIFETFTLQLERNPKSVSRAIGAFHNTVVSLNATSFVSALHNFGKQTHFLLRPSNNTAIPAQPTADSRRKLADQINGNLQGKRMLSSEHGYSINQ